MHPAWRYMWLPLLLMACGKSFEGGGDSQTATGSSTAGAGGSGGATTSSAAAGGGGMLAGECGDGVIGSGEQCDDANDLDTDGCASCQMVCDGPAEMLSAADNHCYLSRGSSDAALNWGDAKALCIGWRPGGNLIGIRSLVEHTLAAALVQTDRSWTGGNDRETEGTFTWVNDEPWGDFTKWAAGQPPMPHDQQDCISLEGGEWVARGCSIEQGYVCEFAPPGSSPVN